MREASARTVPAGAPARAEVARLVDVQLEEPAQPLEPRRRRGEPAGIRAGGSHRVGERDAVVVRAGEHVGDVEPAGQRARCRTSAC